MGLSASLLKTIQYPGGILKALGGGRREAMEKAMAPHSSTLAWKIPWMEEEPGGLQSMGSLRVGTTE